ncbi:MAG: aminotransferase class V-fold PLP-dependent enzyme [Myxococcota bacterium]|nr:aminotransferase class V-fold PLP-dependent enzyme [Myxococcota bacterium]
MSFGRGVRARFSLREDVHFLNHGSFGATPRSVQAAQIRWMQALESEPVDFIVRRLPELLVQARAVVGELVGARGGDLAFVDNASSGVNAVLRSQRFQPGDRLVTLSHVYPAVRNTLSWVAERSGAHVVEVPLPCPVVDDAWLEDLGVALRGARFAVLDHVTSASGLVLPIRRMVQLARESGVPVLVDGAHAPGLLPLKVQEIGADFYTGNLHKWLCAPKGCAFLWASPSARQGLQPTTISHWWREGFPQNFDQIGTRDPAAWLAVHAVREFWESIGGLDAARAHNNALCRAQADLLCERFGLIPAGPPSMRAAMCSMQLPPMAFPPTVEGAMQLNRVLFEEDRVEVPIVAHQGALFLRISAQIYNTSEDYLALAAALNRLVHASAE